MSNQDFYKNHVFGNLKKKVALGNTRRGFKEVASDLLNATGERASDIAKGTFLSPATVARVMDCEENYNPQSQTVERCLIYCNAEVTFEETTIKAKYSNQPKVDVE
jgi:hypothetical protein